MKVSKKTCVYISGYLIELHIGSDDFFEFFLNWCQGHRAYIGHRKHIVPNKRQMIQHFLNSTMSTAEFDETIRALHSDRIGQPIHRTDKSDQDVLAYPVPECMCQQNLPPLLQQSSSSSSS